MNDKNLRTLLTYLLMGKPVQYEGAANWEIIRLHPDGRLRIKQPGVGGSTVDVDPDRVTPAW